MIIIETRKGPVFINDGQIREITFNKDENEVLIDYGDNMPVKPFGPSGPSRGLIMEVENVMYVPDCVPEKYQYKGSRLVELENAKSRLVMINNHLNVLCNIFQDGLSDIKILADNTHRFIKVFQLVDILTKTEDRRKAAEERFIEQRNKYFPEEPKKE